MEGDENTDPSHHFDDLFYSAAERHNAQSAVQGFLADNVGACTLVMKIVGPHVGDFHSFTAAWESVKVFATKIPRRYGKILCEAMLIFSDVKLPQAIRELHYIREYTIADRLDVHRIANEDPSNTFNQEALEAPVR